MWAGWKRVLGAAALLLVGAALALPAAGWGEQETASDAPGVVAHATLTPQHLPRSHFAPASLDLGFSVSPEAGRVPELEAISFDLSPLLRFHAKGLRSCSIKALYGYEGDQVCGPSRVGGGTVESEIALPGQAPAIVAGAAQAYFSERGGVPRILLKVTTGDPVPLVYVIPFEIEPAAGRFGPRLAARRMHSLQGKCGSGHPNCFGQPYSFSGIYGRIKDLDLALHRRFSWRGKKQSFLEARCGAPRATSTTIFRLATVDLGYAEKDPLTTTVVRACRALD